MYTFLVTSPVLVLFIVNENMGMSFAQQVKLGLQYIRREVNVILFRIIRNDGAAFL